MLLWLATAFVAPLYAPLTICAMPCCRQAATPPCCKVVVAHDDEIATVTLQPTVAAAPATIVADVIALLLPHRAIDVADHPRSVDRPLHLLHSVFLI